MHHWKGKKGLFSMNCSKLNRDQVSIFFCLITNVIKMVFSRKCLIPVNSHHAGIHV